jgi:hypothetical protein
MEAVRDHLFNIFAATIHIPTGYELDDRGVGVRVPVGARIFTSPSLSDWLWSPPSLLYNGQLRLFPRV